MEKIKHKSAELQTGITQGASGSIQPFVFVSGSIIRGFKNPIHVKRPNQYKPDPIKRNSKSSR